MSEYSWNEISDLPEDWQLLVADDLSSLADIWKEQRDMLRGSKNLSQFNTELRRQWAIETGIIEGLYTIDRGVTRLLIEKGIEGSLIPHGATNKPVEKILPIIKDQESVIEGLFDFVGQSRPMSTSYIKELHQALTAHQDTVEAVDQFGNQMTVRLQRGVWKEQANNPTTSSGTLHEYCPPEHVASEMDRLIEMHLSHEAAKVSPEVEAAWLHHRFTQIHPFQDGNGRVARALASLVFLRAGWFPLVIVSDQHRDEYISALEEADHGNLSRLATLFSRLQKKAFLEALSISRDVIADQESVKAMIASVADRLRERVETKRAEKLKVFEISKIIETKAEKHLREVSRELSQQIHGIDTSYQVSVDRNRNDNKHWFWDQVVRTAQNRSYFSDLRTYHSWVRLKIRRTNERQTEIVISFHSLGTQFLGLMAVSAFVEHRGLGERGTASLDGPYPACSDIFQFSYNQEASSIESRFMKWLNVAILAGLDQWKNQL